MTSTFWMTAQEAETEIKARAIPEKVKLVCNECGKKRLVSANGSYFDRCPKCGGVDWDVAE